MKHIVALDPDRCKIHFMPPTGWMNDPNGLTVYNGEYHLFYQYNPYSALWGPMHWGHAKSKDLIDWEHLPVALAPSEPYESGGGCFSGSAVVWEGQLNLFYSAATFDIGTNHYAQTQCRAFTSDGINFTKDGNNPLISSPPDGCSPSFRDPKVWKHENDWYMVVGGMKDGKGQVFLYKSPDMRKWEFCSVLAHSDGEMGFIWECPDFFLLDGKYVLIVSALIKGDLHPMRKTMYFVGGFEYETCDFAWEKTGLLDFGDEFYAPQSFLDMEGARTVFGWLNTWNFAFGKKGHLPKPASKKWCGSMSLPRVLSLAGDDALLVNPHPAVSGSRGESIAFFGDADIKTLTEKIFAKGVPCYGINAVFNMVGGSGKFGILFGPGEGEEAAAVMTYDAVKKEAALKRKASQYYQPHISKGALDAFDDEKLELSAYVDGPVIEIYLQKGRACLTGHADPELMLRGFSFFVEIGDTKIESFDVYRTDGRRFSKKG